MALREPKDQTLVVRKSSRKRGHLGHQSHGSWKVAYADFVTAMMAFFLLLWLVNITDPEQKKVLTEYFNPYEAIDDSQEVEVEAGIISLLDGGQQGGSEVYEREVVTSEGEPERPVVPADLEQVGDFGVSSWDRVEIAREEYEALLERVEVAELAKDDGVEAPVLIDPEVALEIAQADEMLEKIKKSLENARETNPLLAKYKEQISIEKTPDGVRVQLMDIEQFSMFRVGSAVLDPEAEVLIREISAILTDVPNFIAVTGHTDARPYKALSGYSNWELSSDRANSARRALLGAGISEVKIERVEGRADNDLLYPDDGLDPRNRRIDLLILR